MPHIAVCLQHGAHSRDILTAVLEAAYIRQQLQQRHLTHDQDSCHTCSSSISESSSPDAPHSRSSSKHREAPQLQVDKLNIDVQDLNCSSSSIRKAAKKEAERNVARFINDLTVGGWHTQPFLLSTWERSGFVKQKV